MAICLTCKNYSTGTRSCYLRRLRFCGEDAKHFAKRVSVIVDGVTADPFRRHLEWPAKYEPEDVKECPHYNEGVPRSW